MHITVACPSCRNRYEVESGLLGLPMRCPNPLCGKVFEVREVVPEGRGFDQPTAVLSEERARKEGPNASEPSRTSGLVGDLVPILDAEIVSEVPPPASEAEQPTQEDERRRAREGESSLTPRPSSLAPSAGNTAQEPQDFSWQSPPPVRRAANYHLPETPSIGTGGSGQWFDLDAVAPSASSDSTGSQASRLRRRVLLAIGLMVLIGGFLVALATFKTVSVLVQSEGDLYSQARGDYSAGKYAAASNKLQELIAGFPRSDNLPHYEFLAEWSQVRDHVYGSQSEPTTALAQFQQFLETRTGDPHLKSYRLDIWQTLRELVERLTALAEETHDADLLAAAKKALSANQSYAPADGRDGKLGSTLARLAKAEGNIATWLKRQRVVDRLNQWLQSGVALGQLKEARRLAKQEGYADDPQIKELLTQLDTAARLRIRYIRQEMPVQGVAAEAVEPGLLIAPALGAPANRSDAKQRTARVVPALARGVLYALDEDNGEVRWATRVGIDTVSLPVRLPATAVYPELLLVLSADQITLTALDAQTGYVYWQHRLSAPCLGRPVIVGRRAYVGTYDGRVHEIETIRGHLLGYFELGQPLTGDGVWQEGTDYLYFPGNSDNVYVLDIAATPSADRSPREKRCVAVLQTGHPSGSLRSPPIVINRVDPYAKDSSDSAAHSGYLILNQTDGLDDMKLQVFPLPIEQPDPPLILQPELRLRGWSWFQPYHDGEKLAYVTDAGVFGLFGINQIRNEDRPLFPEFQDELRLREVSLRLGRAQLVHASENDFWTLASGVLQRLHFDRYNQRIVPLWNTAHSLGSPLHASQIDESGKVLFVVTQDLNRQICLATAVNAENGTVRWQRQLGLECHGDPIVRGQEVLMVDRGGGLFAFERGKYPYEPGREWWHADSFHAEALEAGSSALFLIPGPDNASTYEIACHSQGKRLTIRRYQRASEGANPILSARTFELPAALAGTPALEPQSLLLPLADGTLVRQPLDGGPRVGGPNWRSNRADEGAWGHVTLLGGDEFLTTDGSRGLTRWKWPQNGLFETLPVKKVPTIEMPARIVAAPLVLPRLDASALLHVFVADAEGNLTLFRGPELTLERAWHMDGKITAGPYRAFSYGSQLNAQRIGCIVDRHRLVCVDPTKEQPLWQYVMQGEGILGQPQRIGKMLVLADRSGHFVGLDPADGQPLGAGYTLKVRAAPSATPVAFGPEEALVPLTDGTVFVLLLQQLRDPE